MVDAVPQLNILPEERLFVARTSEGQGRQRIGLVLRSHRPHLFPIRLGRLYLPVFLAQHLLEKSFKHTPAKVIHCLAVRGLIDRLQNLELLTEARVKYYQDNLCLGYPSRKQIPSCFRQTHLCTAALNTHLWSFSQIVGSLSRLDSNLGWSLSPSPHANTPYLICRSRDIYHPEDFSKSFFLTEILKIISIGDGKGGKYYYLLPYSSYKN